MADEQFNTSPPPPSAPMAEEAKASGLAITTLILGIASCTICCLSGLGGLTGIVGIILGIIEKGKINSGEHNEKGRQLNTWGIVLSVAGIVLTIIFWISIIIFNANNPNAFK